MAERLPPAPVREEPPGQAPAPVDEAARVDVKQITVPAAPGQRNYFPELDGLRFFAFALVYLFHQGVPQWNSWVRSLLGLFFDSERVRIGDLRDLGLRIQYNGWVGVQIFFVLSGFLITTLLLREERRYGRVDLRYFWVRRILRIWPLYYLVLLIAVFVVPGLSHDGLWNLGMKRFLSQQFPAFLAFLGNWSMGFLGPPPNDAASVLWSVCVEEQFYIVCPILLVFIPRLARVPALVVLASLGIVARYVMAQRGTPPLLFQYGSLAHLDSLLSGVLLAFLLYRYGHATWLRRGAAVLPIPVLLAFGWLLTRPEFGRNDLSRLTWDYVALWLATCGLITALVVREGWLNAVLGYSRVVWLGRISYGLYMYHEIALWLGKWWFESMGWFPNKEILQTIACFSLTVGISALSYYYFERPFLTLKRGWTRVPSRPD